MNRLTLALVLAASGLTGCSGGQVEVPSSAPTASAELCSFATEPAVISQEGSAVLLRWEVEDQALWASPRLPADSAYQAYRRQIEVAGADIERPAQHVPPDQRGQENWGRELRNVELAYSGEAGDIRPVQCLGALLFAHQNARVRQLETPTEFLASILRRRIGEHTRLRIYVGAGDELFPPKSVYGFDQVERDVADGWEYLAMLHNHTIQNVDGEVRLGVPAPSISDVQLLNGLVAAHGLQEAWVTNGVYTIEIRADDLVHYLEPE